MPLGCVARHEPVPVIVVKKGAREDKNTERNETKGLHALDLRVLAPDGSWWMIEDVTIDKV